MNINFSNKKYLVTGVTSGIGKETCLQLLLEGASVIGIGRDAAKVQDLIDEFPVNRFQFVSFDLHAVNELETMMSNVMAAHDKLDGLVLSAGKEETLPLSMYKPDKMESIFELNVYANAELMRLFSKKKYSQNRSSIVVIASVMSILGQPGKVGYCSSKSAILGLVKSAALELAKRGIRINAISPGVVNTPMTAGLFGQIAAENIERINAMHPLGIGEVSDIYPLILFLLSENARWLTGQNIVIDGGYSIH